MRGDITQLQLDISLDQIINVAINIWLIIKHLKIALKKESIPSKFFIPMNNLLEFLSNENIELIDLTNTKYDTGLAVEVVSYTCDPSLLGTEAVICEMIRPIVKYKNKIIRQGQVILAPPKDSHSRGKK